MYGVNLPRQRVGAPIRARMLNRTEEVSEQFGRLRVGNGLALQWLAGTPHIRDQQPERFKIKLTSELVAGKYAWTEQVDTTGGGVANGARSDHGSDYAWEDNATTGLTGKIVWAERSWYTSEVRFQFDTC